MDVDVGERVSGHVVEEGQVQEATLFPVHFCVREDEMQDSHEQNVRGLSKKMVFIDSMLLSLNNKQIVHILQNSDNLILIF